jgi:stage II sporulation protein D
MPGMVPGCAAIVLACAAPWLQQPVPDRFVFDGRGSGHGVGLAQYGARGFAREEHRGHRWILRHYYPGTRLERGPAGDRIRVRLQQGPSAVITGASALRGADGDAVRLRPARRYRLAAEGDRIVITAESSGVVRARRQGVVRISGSTPLTLAGRAENGVRDGRYRGRFVVQPADPGVLVVDDVRVEDYLAGVVPSEMPAAWPRAALRAQAVAARSYAATSRRPDRPFDVYADVRSQQYGGVLAEHERTTAAVRTTSRVIVVAMRLPARTLFHASSGGRTAAIEEIFGGAPVPYLRSVADPYDRASPFHHWAAEFDRDDLDERLGSLGLGAITNVAVTSRTASGRAAEVEVTGTGGAATIPAPRARALLGLRSTWFEIAPG